MPFLAPLFLAALAAMAVPWLLHVRRRQPKNRVPFSAVQFLDGAQPLQRRHWRVEDLLLLALRCLALALLAFAFARPFLGADSPLAPEPAVQRLILVDTSASLRGERFAAAQREAERLVAAAGPNDFLAVAGFDRVMTVVLPIDRARLLPAAERAPAAIAAIRSLRAGWGETNLDAALTAAADLLEESRPSNENPAVLAVVSDFQRGARTAELTNFDWPRRLQVTPVFVGAEGWTNAGLHPAGGEIRAGQPVTARVRNAAASERGTFRVAWDGAPAAAIEVPPGQDRSLALKSATTRGSAELTGDDFDFDNRAWFAPAAAISLPIDYRGSARIDDPRDTLFFLSRALGPTPDYTVELRPSPAPDAPPAALTIVDGAAAIDAPLRERLAAGSPVLLVLRDAGSAAALESLTGAKVPLREMAPVDPVLFGRINFDDPVFQPFADPRFSNFSQISTWRYRRIDPAALPGAAVLAAFDTGDPALLRVPVGRGALFVLTTSWRPADSQLALSSKFAPLLLSLIEQSPAFARSATQVWVGESVTLPPGATPRIKTPDGKVLDARDGRFAATDAPGLYETTNGRFAFAVNPRPTESELTPLTGADLKTLGLPLDPVTAAPATVAQREARQREELEREQKWWWWLLVAAIGALVAESALGAWTSRARTVPATS